jgi:5-methyltetrahydrofolate--homocysteine methyltransferase
VNDILQDLSIEVQKGDTEKVRELVTIAIDQGIAPIKILEDGLRPGMDEIGQKFEILEVYLPDMILAGDAMSAGVDLLRPHLGSGEDKADEGLILLGTIEGDVHEIGKNIVGIMLEAAGFKIVDLGHDVPVLTFAEKVMELEPDIVGISALMTTTMVHMPRVINALDERDLRKNVKVIVGGAPVLPEWAQKIGADGYGETATEAVDLVKELMR